MTQPLPVGTVLKNQYRIVRLVGGGGMAWVYQVEELPTGSGRLWALKELRPQTVDREEQATARRLFEQEAQLLRGLSHVNIPVIADFFDERGRACLVMEFIWGESLEKRLEAANAPLLESDVLPWAIQLCDALDYLHSRQPPIIFRDMKPSNVMVTNTGLVKLIDFGIARTYKRGKKRDTVAMGSENYAAPEQWGKDQTDARSDVYALGATLYHLLANMAPTPAFLQSEPLPLGNYNGALSKGTIAVIEKAMARPREQRYQTALEMRQAIVALLPAPAPSRVPAPVPSRVPAPYVAPPVVPPPAAERQPQRPAPQVAPAASAAPQGAAMGASAAPASAGQEPSPAAKAAPRHVPQSTGPSSEPARPAPRPLASRPAPVAPPTKLCPFCHSKNRESARFCVVCGRALGPVGPAILRVVEPVRAAWEMPVRRSPMLLGRASEAEDYEPDFDMTFYDDGDFVSRRHARITKGRGGYFITDLDSSNGTLVNGQHLVPQRAYLLRNGDRIKVGLVVIQFWQR